MRFVGNDGNVGDQREPLVDLVLPVLFMVRFVVTSIGAEQEEET
jgi:hypothetical protein